MIKRCAKLLISFVFLALTRFAASIAALFGRRRSPRCVVLYYHAVPPEQRRRFARQMDILLRWATPVRADLSGPLPPGKHYAAVTFDDGFQSVLHNALPELEQRRIPSTIFVVTSCLGQHPGWLGDGYLANQSEITMTADQLRSLSGPLVTLGSHTVSHPYLTRLPAAEARREIEDSRRDLEALANCGPVTLFSFPYGAASPELITLCREAGYRRAFTIEPVLAFSELGEFVTGRVSVNPTDWPVEFWLKLLGGYRWQAAASKVKRQIRSAGSFRGRARTSKQDREESVISHAAR